MSPVETQENNVIVAFIAVILYEPNTPAGKDISWRNQYCAILIMYANIVAITVRFRTLLQQSDRLTTIRLIIEFNEII